MIDPDGARLQVDGCVTFGLGQALFEQLVFDGGQLVNGTLADYQIAASRDMPQQLTATILEEPDAEVHGMGEACLPPVMPAIANAIARATGLRFTTLPVTPEAVLRGLRGRVEP